MPLGEFVGSLAAEHDIPLVLNHKKLEEASVSSDTPVTCALAGVSLGSLLNQLLRELELTYGVRDGVLQITTPEDAESQLLLVAYPVHDLVAVPPFNPHDHRFRDFDALMELIVAVIRPDSWDFSGPAPTEFIGGWLLISQTQSVHEDIERLLRDLRHALAFGETPCLFARPEIETAESRILAALEKSLEISYVDAPLRNVCGDLGKQLSIPVCLFLKRFEEAGVKPDVFITASLPTAPARIQLSRLLDPLDLALTVRDEALFITTPEDAESQLATHVYDVRSLLETEVSLFHTDDPHQLIAVIRNHTRPELQRVVTGPGAIEVFRGILVASETLDVHQRIERILGEFHRAARWRDTGAVMPATAISPDERHSWAAPHLSHPKRMHTRIYDVRSLAGGNSAAPCSNERANPPGDSLIATVTDQIAPQSWYRSGGSGQIDCVRGFLIVTQTWQNQAALEALLEQLRAALGAASR